ncbi:periplasmic binding protein [Gloeocapsa sp. PCC 7428]|nr:periplasmic binding protein [Gloeocapsa sp. PCC 7428]
MFKKFGLVLLFALGIGIILIVSACNSTTGNNLSISNSAPITDNCRPIKHTMGETCVPINPQRIVVLDNMMLEGVLALGQEPIGGPLRYVPPHMPVGEMIDIGSEGGVNLERVLALKPDLILGLADPWVDAQPYPQLSQIAPTVLVKFKHSGEWKEIFAFVGEVLGKSEQVNQIMADYTQRLERFKSKMNTSEDSREHNQITKTQVSVVRIYPDMITLYTKPGFAGTILEDAGLSRPASQDLDLEETQALTGDVIQYSISKEVFNKADGDVVFVIVGSWDSKIKNVLKSLKADPLWSKLSAVQQSKVYEVGDHWVGSGPIAANAVINDLFKYLVNTP